MASNQSTPLQLEQAIAARPRLGPHDRAPGVSLRMAGPLRIGEAVVARLVVHVITFSTDAPEALWCYKNDFPIWRCTSTRGWTGSLHSDIQDAESESLPNRFSKAPLAGFWPGQQKLLLARTSEMCESCTC